VSIEAVVRVIYSTPPRGSRHVGALDAYRVLLAVAEDADEDGRGNYPSRSQQTIADELDLERRTVRDALAALLEQGRLVLITEGVPRRSGAVYDLAWTSGDAPATRAGIPHELGQGIPPTRAGNSGRELGQATRAGIPCRDPDPYPENPPTPLTSTGGAAPLSGGAEVERLERVDVRAILETNGAPRRLIGRAKPTPPDDPMTRALMGPIPHG